MEYIKFGTDNPEKTILNRPLNNKDQKIKFKTETVRLKPKTEIISTPQNILQRDTSEILLTEESEMTSKTQSSPLMKVLCATMASALLFIGVYLSEIKAPEYMESAIMTLIERAKEKDKVQVSAEEDTKIIGGRVLVSNENAEGNTESDEIIKKIIQKPEDTSENASFAEAIRSEYETRSETKSHDDDSSENNTPAQATKEAVQVIAKNLSKGSDKLYFTNKTDLEIDINDLLVSEYPISQTKLTINSPPKVLIIHTHGTEAYIDTSDRENSRSSDISKNVVRAGEELANVLRSYGIPVIHSKTMHDEISYVNSYASSKKEAKEYLSEYPSIEYIIDVHRDSLGTEEAPVKTYTEINGIKTAQLMLVMGTNAAGGDHPDFRKNLTVASHIQEKTNSLYPTLMRPMSIRPIIFNQNLTAGSMILEVGSDANTLSEAVAAVRMFGRVLAEMVIGKKE